MSGDLKLFDGFCCAGGAGIGYEQAGFFVTGADLVVHKRNPHTVVQADVFLLDPEHIGRNFDAVHLSPRCQGYTNLRHAKGAIGAPQEIGRAREWAEATGLPYVIENVEDAAWDMRDPVLLCGTMFGLGAYGYELQRHRLFETNWGLTAPTCDHSGGPVIGVYGGHARCRSAKHGGRGTKDTWPNGHLDAASRAMGIGWMTLAELSEAIPPAYTAFIGAQLRRHIEASRMM